MADGNEEIRPKAEGGEVINLVVKDQESNEVHFKVKKHTKFEKVFTAYCAKKSIDPGSVKFLYDGKRLATTNTPEQMDMEDGDVIDCMVEQVGGEHQQGAGWL